MFLYPVSSGKIDTWVGINNPTGVVCTYQQGHRCAADLRWLDGDAFSNAYDSSVMRVTSNDGDPCLRLKGTQLARITLNDLLCDEARASLCESDCILEASGEVYSFLLITRYLKGNTVFIIAFPLVY